jgi:hypothetical protein
MSNLSGADIPWEPGQAEWPMVHAGVEGGKSTGAGATGRGGAEAEHSEAGGGATVSTLQGGEGSQQAQDVAVPLRGG